MSPKSVARLEVALDDVEPPVSRTIDVPAAIRLDRLHETLQAALGWTNSHLWEIQAGEPVGAFPIPIGRRENLTACSMRKKQPFGSWSKIPAPCTWSIFMTLATVRELQ